ncbi:TPA: DUF550 domain-containing protein [Salmonella enterica]|uniref:dATP/dGTP diphosphohydrolase MazZ domain-containing protein n=1 Tax=Salmonella newport TaxID=108619 RepID=A0A5W3PYW3_SALNE|nr:DUF550 domain-containing protein [Salmonella enterica]EAB5418710.1 DUF550 domain-containing protein [Salmonella enterica subsp. enterica serovar Newport]EBS0627301.1 DUF550 domain-containing protein [Salmonella enterica subsp. enterica serovar Stanley]EEC0847290.1 DUF550 domain-containing protein [Salmonella enterica subsp. enterica serovar Hvittingfoss]EAB4496501.1 DUF550 domain-containing protein [Salmonella enterica]
MKDKQALREVAEKATKGEWWSDVVETDGEYGEGEDRVSGYHSYAVYVGHESLLDMINSTAACIHTEWDHDYHMAWDETAKRNAEFIAAANPATVLALLDENIQLQREKDAIEAVALALRDDMRQVREQLAAAERRKADNQEPAGYHVIKECGKVGCSVATLEEAEKTRDFWNKKWTIRPYFYTAQPASERERIRREHAEWSDATFGDVGPVGPLKHLSKEALEAAADPSDPLEWADMQFLLWDAQRRMGISDEFITRAMIEKLEINKSRQWPEPKDGEPRLHIKEQPAPVVPPAIEPDYEVIKGILPTTNPDEYACCIAADMWNACRADMFQGGQPVSNRDELSSPVIPDGYALVPIVPTEDMVINGFESEPDPHFSDEKVWAEYEALSGCRRAARRAELCWAAMIKAAPKQEGNNG